MSLRYVTDAIPGYTRKKSWVSFGYFDEKGKKIRDQQKLARIRALGIPPAYTQVWICPFENGHLQATARDARGRKQYFYHRDWKEKRDEAKFHRMLAFAHALSLIRPRINRDLCLLGMPREKVLAAIVRLLDTAYIRIGNEEYAKENGSFGLTTLQNRHVQGVGAHMKLVFKGKSGVKHEVTLADKRLRKIILACQDIPGHELFEYRDEQGKPRDITSEDVNGYLQEVSCEEITAKDFRTWHGTLSAAIYLWQCSEPKNKKDIQKNIREAIVRTSKSLGNTVAVCKKCYIHPQIFFLYQKRCFDAQTVSEEMGEKYPHLHMNEKRLMCFLMDV